MGTHFQTAAVVLHTNEKSRKDVAISWPLVAFCRGRLESTLASGDRNYSKREGGEAEVGERTSREGEEEEEREMGEMEGRSKRDRNRQSIKSQRQEKDKTEDTRLKGIILLCADSSK